MYLTFGRDTIFIPISAPLMWTLSLSLGDLKLVEKPMACTVGPHDFVNIKASIKVSSTENGIIFGNIGMSSTLHTYSLKKQKKNFCI